MSMKHPTQRLSLQLNQALDLMNQPSLLSFSVEERQAFRVEADRLRQNLADLKGSYLVIGLIGGTGVGKSSLMNALAGAEIASTSHRRPHTDQVLIYRHEAMNQALDLTLEEVPWREITHGAEAIQHILLCDLPDFDSLMGEHRERVLNFLEYLDVLVWVTSPEKYADKVAYEFLELVPKAGQNFYFVLNKADLFYSDETKDIEYEELGRVTKSYQTLIRDHGVTEPLLFVISAKETIGSEVLEPWNQFGSFKQQIFQQRDIKQITAIKTANLDVEIRQLLSALKQEVSNLEAVAEIIENASAEVSEQLSTWVQTGQEAFDLWLNKYIKPEILSEQWEPSKLVGPGYIFGILLQSWSKRPKEEKPASDFSDLAFPDEIAVFFRRRLEWLEDRISRQLLQRDLPASFGGQLQKTLNVPDAIEDLKDDSSRVAAGWISEPIRPSFWGFKILQTLTYLLILIFFLFALGGEDAWRGVLNSPGISSVIDLLLAGIQTLFSSKGLAALGSYAALTFFFAFRFYRRYRRSSEKVVAKTIKSLKGELSKLWEEKMKSILNDMDKFGEDLRAQISTISVLTQERD